MHVTAATNKNLGAAIKERKFREDLYYRLKAIHIQTPSLREVPEDIPGLAILKCGPRSWRTKMDLPDQEAKR